MGNITRRQALAGLGCFGAGLGLSGCASPIVPFCPGDPTISDERTPLTIDVHTHVFNGSDLQIEGFFDHVVRRQTNDPHFIAVVLKMLAKNLSPSGSKELAALADVEVALRNCNGRTFGDIFYSHAQESYTQFLQALTAANNEVRGQRYARPSTARRLDAYIDSLPRDYGKYQQRRARFAFLEPTFEGNLNFVLQNFNYRYVNVYQYLMKYSTDPARKIDIMVAHLVDFDWPLGGGSTTTTSLTDQFRVMDKISQLTGGRVLCFAPFDPFKEVAHNLGLTTESSFANVKNAITQHGFVGVKIYPPMGFAPFGNATLRPNFWDRDWIPQSLRAIDLRQKFDAVLGDLYLWCAQNGVPIMGHASKTVGPSDDFQDLAGAEHWGPISNKFAGLRLNYGHFGMRKLSEQDQQPILESYMDNANGNFVYADSGYFSEVLDQEPQLEALLTKLYKTTSGKGDAALSHRLMYGTDWEMIIREGPTSDDYLRKFEKMYASIERNLGAKGKLANRFFGVNAVNYLGLGANQPARKRLDSYYQLTSKPAWMAKVDKLPPAIA